MRTLTTAAAGLSATAAVVLAVLVAGRGPRPSRAADSLLRGWANCWLVPAGVRLRITGRQFVDPRQAYVIVSNHQSNLDPMAHLAALRLPMRFLAMHELFEVPVLGAALRRLGMIDVNRADPDLTAIAASVARALSLGTSVLIYPEGATSGDGMIDGFHTGAFALAIANNVPVLPLATSGTRAVWRPGSNAIHADAVRIIIGAPIPTDGLTTRDAVTLRDAVRGWIVETYEECRGSS